MQLKSNTRAVSRMTPVAMVIRRPSSLRKVIPSEQKGPTDQDCPYRSARIVDS